MFNSALSGVLRFCLNTSFFFFVSSVMFVGPVLHAFEHDIDPYYIFEFTLDFAFVLFAVGLLIVLFCFISRLIDRLKNKKQENSNG